MKKIFMAGIIASLLFAASASAEKLDDNVPLGQEIGSFWVAAVSDSEKYVVNSERDIIGGPFVYVSDYGGFVYASNPDGSYVLFDLDGSILCETPASDSIIYPENGIYAVMRGVSDGGDYDLCTAFEIYDYTTGEKLCTLDRPVLYYLEQQTDKMVIENDEGKLAFINKYGELQSDYVYDEVKKRFNPDYMPYPKAYAIVVQDGVEKYIDWDLNEIDLDNYNGQPFITNCSYPVNEHNEKNTDYYIMESGDKTGLYDIAEDKYVIPLQNEFEIIGVMDNTYVYIQNDIGDGINNAGMLDMDGNLIIPLEYSYLDHLGGDAFRYEKSIGSDENGIFRMEYGIIKNGRVVFAGDKYVQDILGDGLIVLFYPDPDESYEYAHNYTDYIYEIVNYAGHNMTNDTYTAYDYTDGVLYTSHAYHSDEPPTEPVDISRDFAVIDLNGKYLDFDGVIRDDRTLVPVREIVEGLGGTVEWNGSERSVRAVIDGRTIDLTIDSAVMTVDGTDNELDVPAQIINEKTMIPLRAVSEAVGASVDWDGSIRCVYINKDM